jgi:hypothetical protein
MIKLYQTLGAIILLLWLSVTASLTSLVMPVMVHHPIDLVDLRYGWPLWFVSQDQSRLSFTMETALPALRPIQLLTGGIHDLRLRAVGINLLFWALLFFLLLYGTPITRKITGKSSSFHRSSRQVAWLLLVGYLVTVGSLAIPNRVDDNAQLVDMHYGWPLPFIVQDQSRFQFGGDGPQLPQSVRVRAPLEDPTTFLAPPFWANVMVWGTLVGVLWWGITKVTVRMQQQ